MSAQSGYAMQDFLQVAKDLDARMEKNISTSALNKLIGDMFEHRPPAKVKGKRFKIFYACRWKSVLSGSNYFVTGSTNWMNLTVVILKRGSKKSLVWQGVR